MAAVKKITFNESNDIVASLPGRRSGFVASDAIALDLCGVSICKYGQSRKAGRVLSRLFFCLSFLIVTSVCIMIDFATAGTAQEIKEEVKEGVKETKKELKKMPEEFKKAGKEIKKKSEEVKKNVEADVEEGKQNVRSLTK
jgi:hypothetical protein